MGPHASVIQDRTDTGAVPEDPSPYDGRRRRVWLTFAGWAVLTLVLWWRLAPNGYNTSDYGFIIGQAWRILHGEVPHVDFISARPAGSALLHTVDFLIPLPLVEASRLVALALSVGVALLSGVAVLGRAPWRWSLTGHAVVATVALFTINTFQIGPWYTVDGLIFTLASIAALRTWETRPDLGLPVVALLTAGLAPLFKQSFFMAVPLAAGWAVWRLAASGQLDWRRFLGVGLLVGLPGILYVAFITLAGGWTEMLSQLTSATQPNWVGTMGTESIVAPPLRHALLAVAALGVVVLVWFLPHSWASSPTRRILLAGAAGAAYLCTVALGLSAHLSMYDQSWSTRLFWVASGATLIAGATQRRLRMGEVGVILAAWMTVLSWGMPWPLLSAGGLLLVVAYVLSDPTGNTLLHGTRPGRAARGLWAAVAALALVTTAVVLDDAIHHRVMHRDLPAAQLTEALNRLDGDFGRVVTNPTTAAFLEDAVRCVQEHPAQGVAFGSWNSDLYAVLGLRNPLATDGSNTLEITGAEEQYRQSVRELASRGDFLVLFPLVNPEEVHTLGVDDLPNATEQTAIPEYWFTSSATYAWMAQALSGQRVACGSWVGVWEPEPRQ